jgi:hypothetical protein
MLPLLPEKLSLLGNVITDVPITFFQMELLSPVSAIYGLDGSFVLKINMPNTYLDGSLTLTFSSIAVDSNSLVHTYAVPFINYTTMEFQKVIETKDHLKAPLEDGTYNLFVIYTMRKDKRPRNASVQLVIDFDDCAKVECNNGTCVNEENAHTCNCDAGYSGDTCENNIDDCLEIICSNGATCQDLVDDFKCLCPPNYFGKLCNSRNDACASNLCINGAECTEDDGIA